MAVRRSPQRCHRKFADHLPSRKVGKYDFFSWWLKVGTAISAKPQYHETRQYRGTKCGQSSRRRRVANKCQPEFPRQVNTKSNTYSNYAKSTVNHLLKTFYLTWFWSIRKCPTRAELTVTTCRQHIFSMNHIDTICLFVSHQFVDIFQKVARNSKL